MRKLKPMKDNKEARIGFVRYWAEYVRNNSDEVWGRQQSILINAMMHNAKYFQSSPEEYLKLKGEWRKMTKNRPV